MCYGKILRVRSLEETSRRFQEEDDENTNAKLQQELELQQQVKAIKRQQQEENAKIPNGLNGFSIKKTFWMPLRNPKDERNNG